MSTAMNDLLRLWPILLFILGGFSALGKGLYYLIKWTHDHDSRVQRLEDWRSTTDARLVTAEARVYAVETKANSLEVAVARLEVK